MSWIYKTDVGLYVAYNWDWHICCLLVSVNLCYSINGGIFGLFVSTDDLYDKWQHVWIQRHVSLITVADEQRGYEMEIKLRGVPIDVV